MIKTKPIVIQMQSDCLDEMISISNLLRKAKVTATKLKLSDFLQWIEYELNGYSEIAFNDYPQYRKIHGQPECLNAYTGEWVPIIFKDRNTSEIFSRAFIGQPAGGLAEILKNGSSGEIIYPYNDFTKSKLIEFMKNEADYRLTLSYGHVWNIVNTVRNTILDWSLELEKKGILGDNLSFSENEKKEAISVTNHIVAQNIGVLGNISDHAAVKNHQKVSISNIDPSKVQLLIKEIEINLDKLPYESKDPITKNLKALKKEIAEPHLNQHKLSQILQSIRSTCEGATGNLVAEGMLSLIKNLLGG